ncbi:MAG: glycosyltransferase [Planctomycetes bacterium]|nr:glycosyltransferase [Planctomycetota bacterium]
MRVGFDVSPLQAPHPHGVVRVVAGLVGALERRGQLEVVRLSAPAGMGSARWRQVELPRAASRLGLVGIHTLVSAFPLRGPGRRIATIHELPWLHGERENAGWRHRLWARLGPRRADLIVTATERTARDVRLYSGAASERVRVVPWGVDAAFSGAADPRDAQVLARHGLAPRGYLLCAGGGRAKKRPEAALAAAVELARRGGPRLPVVVTGPVEPPVAALGGLACVGEVTDAALAALYAEAGAVLLLARSEGFGLPALEALACGAPVVVARGGAQAEVAGEVGLVADPADPASVALAIERALASTAAECVARRARAAAFSWERSAALVEALWAELCA